MVKSTGLLLSFLIQRVAVGPAEPTFRGLLQPDVELGEVAEAPPVLGMAVDEPLDPVVPPEPEELPVLVGTRMLPLGTELLVPVEAVPITAGAVPPVTGTPEAAVPEMGAGLGVDGNEVTARVEAGDVTVAEPVSKPFAAARPVAATAVCCAGVINCEEQALARSARILSAKSACGARILFIFRTPLAVSGLWTA
jgi:hypothetical protein